MCYNLESSIIALVIGWTSAYLMFKRNKKFDLFFYPLLFTFSFMQLAEALMWYDTGCGILNKIGGYIGYFSLSSHALAQGISLYLINKNIIGILIGLLSISYLTYKLPKIDCSKKIKHIEWGFDSGFYRWIYILTVGIAAITNIGWKYKLIIIGWYTFTWLYFYHKQYNIKKLNYIFDGTELTNQFASAWCHISALSAPFIYLLGSINF